MAKKNKTMLIVGGLAVAGIAVYLLTRPKASAATTVITTPGTPTTTSGNATQTILNAAVNALSNWLGGSKSSTPSTAIPLAPTTTTITSPASSIPYINPIVNPFPITAGDGSNLDTFDFEV